MCSSDLSTTITLVSVFIPIVFLQGQTGRLFREFSIVIAGAVVISSFVALSFTPMIATKLLRKQKTTTRFYIITERFFVWLNDTYKNSLSAFLRRRWIAIVILFASAGLTALLWMTIPAEMAPMEDRSQVSISTITPEGATYEFVRDYIEDIANTVADLVPEKESVTMMIRGGGGNVRLVLVKPDQRDRSQQEIANQLASELRTKTQAVARVTQQSTFGGRRGGLPIQYVLQATNIEKLREVLPEFMARVSDSPVLQTADVNLKFSKPELQIHINRDKASSLGVSTQNIGTTLQLALSGQRFGYFFMNGKQYQIGRAHV